MTGFLVATAAALAISGLAQAVLMPLLRTTRAVDVPGVRSSHAVPTPRGAGVGVLVAVIAGLGLAGQLTDIGVLPGLGIGLAAIVGLVDDFRSLAARSRLALQLAVAILIALPFGWGAASAAFAVLGVVAYVNAFNFMDGINGISAVSTVVCGGQLLWLGATAKDDMLLILGAVAAAAALGFLPFNVPRARIFLGDVGSYGLGALLAWAFLHALSIGLPWPQVLAGPAIYLADTGVTLVRRLLRREDVFAAHRQHTYQRLTQAGLSHFAVSLLIGVATVIVLLSVGVGWSRAVPVAAVPTAVATLVVYLLLPRLLGPHASGSAMQRKRINDIP